MARPEGFEPSTNRFEVCDSIQLSYGRLFLFGVTAVAVREKPTIRLKKN